MRRQFVLDKKTNLTLNRLAAEGNGNFSAIVRKGIDLVAEQAAAFEVIERDPGFRAMMERSEREIRAGNFITLDELKRQIRAKRRKAS